MASITLIIGLIVVALAFLSFSFPLVYMIFVNKKIEKRYHCKLNIEMKNFQYMPFYAYAKYTNPAKTIAAAVLFNSQKIIDKNPCLKEINYKLNTAPKMEKIICTICYLINAITLLSIFVFAAYIEIYGF